MGFIIDEKTFINDNVILHGERMESKYSRFLEKTPTFVTYYHVNNLETTVDNGLQNIERLLGDNSPVKFNEIKNFPIYGIEQIVIQLQDELEGLTGSYDGEGIVLPDTISPLPNSMFVIDALEQKYVFMITEVNYDTIRSNSFTRISFTLKATHDEYVDNLIKQTSDKYDCNFTAIGTDEKAIIRSEDKVALLKLEEAYQSINEHYKKLFFSTRYNSFIYENPDLSKLYDRFINFFINSHNLFNRKNDYDTLYLTLEDLKPNFYRSYDTSFYRAIENQDFSICTHPTFNLYPITSPISIFTYYRDFNTFSVELQEDGVLTQYIPEEDMLQLKDETVVPDNVLLKIIHKHMHKTVTSIADLHEPVLNRYHSWMGYNRQSFLYVPLVLFILRHHYNNLMKQ